MGSYAEAVYGQGTITLDGDPDFAYATVNWTDSNGTDAEWTFSGPINGRGVMEYYNCLKTVTEYDEDGDAYPVLDYNYGTGYIQFTDHGLIWSDDQEHIADDTSFVKYE